MAWLPSKTTHPTYLGIDTRFAENAGSCTITANGLVDISGPVLVRDRRTIRGGGVL